MYGLAICFFSLFLKDYLDLPIKVPKFVIHSRSLNNKGRLKLSWTTLSESCRVKVEELSMENFSDLDIDPAVHGKIWMKQFRTGLEPILSKLREHIKSGLNSLMSKVVNKEYTVSTLCNF